MNFGEPYQVGKFKVGDVVKLKSGGESMSVEGFHKDMEGLKWVTDHRKVYCAWHNKEGDLRRELFHEDQLELAI